MASVGGGAAKERKRSNPKEINKSNTPGRLGCGRLLWVGGGGGAAKSAGGPVRLHFESFDLIESNKSRKH